MDPKFITYR